MCTGIYFSRLLGGAALVILVLGVCLLVLFNSFQNQREATQAGMLKTTRYLQLGMTHAFESVDNALERVKDVVHSLKSPKQLNDTLTQVLKFSPHLRQVIIADKEGQVIADSALALFPTLPRVKLDLPALGLSQERLRSLGDRMLLGIPQQGRFLGAAHDIGARNDLWFMPIALLDEGPQGRHSIVAALNPQALFGSFQSAVEGSQGSSALVHLDGHILFAATAKRHRGAAMKGKQLHASWQETWSQGDEGLVPRLPFARQQSGFTAYRISPIYPLVTLVSVTDEDILSGWIHKNTAFIVLISITPIATMLLIGLLLWQERRRLRLNDRIRVLSEVVEKSPAAVMITDPKGAIIYINKSFETLFGYSAEQVLGNTPRMLKSGLTEDFVYAELWQTITAGGVWSGEMVNRTACGQLCWTSCIVSGLINDQGEMGYYVAVESDTTEAKQRELDLHKLSTAVEQSPIAIVITNQEGAIEYVNPHFCNISGYSAQEVLGENPRLLKSGEMAAAYYQELWSTITRGEVWRGEFRNRRKNGSTYWESATIAPVRDINGQTSHYIALKEDISLRKSYEEQLIEERHKYQEASRVKSDFLATISHEIRTPMNTILGMTGELKESHLSGEQLKLLQSIQAAASNLLQIINDVLDFSRFEAGSIELFIAPLLLRQVVSEAEQIVAFQIRKQGIRFLTYMDSTVPPFIFGDAQRLRQVLVNLLVNASKFTEQGTIALLVHLQPGKAEASDQQELCFRVVDTGIGISEAHRDKLFHAFSQADGSITRQYGGTGLGLSISKHLVGMMGGTIGFESCQGVGSTFWFTLPLQADQTEDGTPQWRPILKEMQIYSLHDHPIHLNFYESFLEQLGGIVTPDHFSVDEHVGVVDRLREHPQLLLFHLENMGQIQIQGMVSAIRARYFELPMVFCADCSENLPLLNESMWGVYFVHDQQDPSRLYQILEQAVSAPRPIRELAQSGPQKRILVVDDSTDNLELIRLFLKRQPYTLEFAESGQEAVDKVRQRPSFDLILMDVQMPGMDGYQATRTIRLWEKANDLASIPIIALTAHAMPEHRENSLRAGCQEHLTKPIHKLVLIQELQRFLA